MVVDLGTAVVAVAGGGVIGALWAGWALAGRMLAAQREAARVVDEGLALEPARSLHAAMSARFPAETKRLRRQMIRIARGDGSAWERQCRIANEALRVRAGLVKSFDAIPDAEIAAILDDHIALTRRLQEDPALMARFVARGDAALPPGDPQGIVAERARMWARAYRLMAEHRGAGPLRTGLTGDDIARFQVLVAREARIRDGLQRLELLDPGDEMLGDAFLEILTLARNARFEGADRLRAHYALLLTRG